ncbi:hypothetical protein Pmar_PMAR012978 [Perkinsus marinus ATCC 50983]|uniref:Uncharacterized protein n=1 Tax=Perkinsus marinus (strain ATCC 50983 / TXsc) TaxID=423536 RepID=C5KV28_PERM5|nr:hypothetical protein Pmar_PMAR012978 [Perkinsus marinus ATCC 50983]EER11665.1 hypothetical protein Pmar_PMAR012978 [Perkinsus marinus ATCC 50983]|eukprot:XP_002779870.1 hypothetical protein Pmar_PMAR012978 [Perkinsus marinus ATCC 50983]
MAENGVFRVCVTDQAQYSVSKRFREYLFSRSVVHCATEAYDEERLGWYERSRKELTVTLRAMVSEGQAMDSINQVRQRLALCTFVHNAIPYDDSSDLAPWAVHRSTADACTLYNDLLGREEVCQWLGSGLEFEDLTEGLQGISDYYRVQYGKSVESLRRLWLARKAEVRRRLADRRDPAGPGMLTRGKKRVLKQIEEVSKAPRKKL